MTRTPILPPLRRTAADAEAVARVATHRTEIMAMCSETEPVLCERCQGNGEVVTDWDAYLGEGKPMTDAVAECDACCGTGYTDYASQLDTE